jgi:hypothetical protein
MTGEQGFYLKEGHFNAVELLTIIIRKLLVRIIFCFFHWLVITYHSLFYWGANGDQFVECGLFVGCPSI